MGSRNNTDTWVEIQSDYLIYPNSQKPCFYNTTLEILYAEASM